jgi:hypothetical protein
MPFQLSVRKRVLAAKVERQRPPPASPRFQLPIPSFEPVPLAAEEAPLSVVEENGFGSSQTKQPLGLLIDLSDDSIAPSQGWAAVDDDDGVDSGDELPPVAFPKPVQQTESLIHPTTEPLQRQCIQDMPASVHGLPHVDTSELPLEATNDLLAQPIHASISATNGGGSVATAAGTACNSHTRRKRKNKMVEQLNSIMDSTHEQLIQLAKVQVATTKCSRIATNNIPRHNKGQESKPVQGCLLCHFCPCRHLPRQEKKRLAKTPSMQDFTNLSPLTALEKHAQIDRTSSAVPIVSDPNNESFTITWDVYEETEIQLIARLRRLEQTIAWFDHLAYKTGQELKKLRSKMAKRAHEKEITRVDSHDLEHSSSDEDQETKQTQQTDTNRRLKWNNKFLDNNDFVWEDTTNFPSKMPLDEVEHAKCKTFVFRKSTCHFPHSSRVYHVLFHNNPHTLYLQKNNLH